MADAWVLNTQNWLNATYTGVAGWTPVVANGQTGWSTMYALTRALQHELGLSPLSSTFGPATLSALNSLGAIGPSTSSAHPNIVRIVQGAMYCKGYNGGNGDLDGIFSATTAVGVQTLRQDMGLPAGQGSVAPKILKALLTMDAYVLVAGGSTTVRSIQRDLNSRYQLRSDFYIVPADGIYSRDVQRGLMFALQYELGMADGVANGNFGPATQTGIRNQANFGSGNTDASSGKFFIHLFQAALVFNGYPTAYSGNFDAATASIVNSFQGFCVLPTTGRSDFQTWASLLVSTGDTTRTGRAADMITTVTPAKAATLVTNGYQTVGRYLTNSPVANPLDKNIKSGELATIFAANLTVFPIFQEGGTGTAYFSYSKGYTAGQRAHDAAKGYGFKAGTCIYFAVDFDALESEVYAYIVHHFRGIRDGLGSRLSSYRVGIYGARNTCSIVSRRGLAELSFVSGMSTGFSGNLGFPLPANWAFDQILEYEIGSGTGLINIDKDIKSGRDLGQNSVDVPAPPVPLTEVEKAIAYVFRIQGLATEYNQNVDSSIDVSNLTARYLRQKHYSGLDWTVLGGSFPVGFYASVESQVPADEIPLAFKNLPSTAVGGIDWTHMAATASAYIYRGPSMSLTGPEFSDIGGWGGDLATLAADFYRRLNPLQTAYTFATQAMSGQLSSTSYGPEDVAGDIFAWVAAMSSRSIFTTTFAESLRLAVTHTTYANENTYDSFIRLRWGSVAAGLTIVQQAFEQPGDTTDQILFNGSRTYLLQNYDKEEPLYLSDFSIADLRAIAKAFVNRIAFLSTQYSPLP